MGGGDGEELWEDSGLDRVPRQMVNPSRLAPPFLSEGNKHDMLEMSEGSWGRPAPSRAK